MNLITENLELLLIDDEYYVLASYNDYVYKFKVRLPNSVIDESKRIEEKYKQDLQNVIGNVIWLVRSLEYLPGQFSIRTDYLYFDVSVKLWETSNYINIYFKRQPLKLFEHQFYLNATLNIDDEEHSQRKEIPRDNGSVARGYKRTGDTCHKESKKSKPTERDDIILSELDEGLEQDRKRTDDYVRDWINRNDEMETSRNQQQNVFLSRNSTHQETHTIPPGCASGDHPQNSSDWNGVPFGFEPTDGHGEEMLCRYENTCENICDGNICFNKECLSRYSPFGDVSDDCNVRRGIPRCDDIFEKMGVRDCPQQSPRSKTGDFRFDGDMYGDSGDLNPTVTYYHVEKSKENKSRCSDGSFNFRPEIDNCRADIPLKSDKTETSKNQDGHCQKNGGETSGFFKILMTVLTAPLKFFGCKDD